MSDTTAIAWTDRTFNPWWGCTKVSPACDNCYAEALDRRFGGAHWGHGVERRRTGAGNWKKPLKWDREAANGDPRRKVFCASMADVFDTEVPEQWRDDLFDLIERTPNLIWQILTKRPKVARDHAERRPFPKNVWLGTTAETQKMADTRIPILLDTPVASGIRFVSCEPMLEPVNLNLNLGGTLWIGGQRGCWGTHRHSGRTPHDHGPGTELAHGDSREPHHHHDDRCGPGLDWIICGGESGPKARPFHSNWAIDLMLDCKEARVPFFMKQFGSNAWHRPGERFKTVDRAGADPAEWPEHIGIQEFPAEPPKSMPIREPSE